MLKRKRASGKFFEIQPKLDCPGHNPHGEENVTWRRCSPSRRKKKKNSGGVTGEFETLKHRGDSEYRDAEREVACGVIGCGESLILSPWKAKNPMSARRFREEDPLGSAGAGYRGGGSFSKKNQEYDDSKKSLGRKT